MHVVSFKAVPGGHAQPSLHSARLQVKCRFWQVRSHSVHSLQTVPSSQISETVVIENQEVN